MRAHAIRLERMPSGGRSERLRREWMVYCECGWSSGPHDREEAREVGPIHVKAHEPTPLFLPDFDEMFQGDDPYDSSLGCRFCGHSGHDFNTCPNRLQPYDTDHYG